MFNRERSLRKSQLISPYGIGAIVDFPNETLMHAGLDAWEPKEENCLVDDRLALRLNVKIFYEPSPAQNGQTVPFVRFPLWHVCPRCRTMKKANWNIKSPMVCTSKNQPAFKGLTCDSLKPFWRPTLVPVRFVVACLDGHIEDFPWIEWAHSKETQLTRGLHCENPSILLKSTGKSGLMGLKVHCNSCNKSRTMTGAAGADTLREFGCNGERPWLGPEAIEDCQCQTPPRVTQRGATNIYFSKVMSSILIPPYSTYVRRKISRPKTWDVITRGVSEDGSIDESRIKAFSDDWDIPFTDLMEAINHKLNGTPVGSEQSEEEYRYDEYKAFKTGQSRKKNDDLNVYPQNLSEYDSDVMNYFEDMILVEKLTETRALTGFTRMSPPETSNENGKIKIAPLSNKPKSWLPATRSFGEGIFFTIKQSLLDSWSSSENVKKRVNIINLRLNEVSSERGWESREITPALMLLHTLSHILITRLSFDCGYGSSSLRERIYCHQSEDKQMSGVLIYTTASDSAGTLGGLVRQGKHKRFEPVLRQALIDTMNCSSDPLCAESSGQGINSLNLAACHACALLPETSCEEGNRLLDRILLIGGTEDKGLGFFEDLTNKLVG